jgi:hypothetical protein
MTLFDVFYDNLMRVFYVRNSGLLACYNVDCSLCHVIHNFMLLYQFYAKTFSTTCTETFSAKRVRYSRHQLGSILCYVTDPGFALKLVTVYAVLVHVLRFDLTKPETHASGACGGLPGWGFLVLMDN